MRTLIVIAFAALALTGCASIDEVAAIHKAQIGGLIQGNISTLKGAVAANSSEKIADVSGKRYAAIEARYRADLEAAEKAGILDAETAIALARNRESDLEIAQSEIAELIATHASLQEGFEAIAVGIEEINAIDLHAVAEKQRMVRGITGAFVGAAIGIGQDVIEHRAAEAKREAEEKLEREAEKQELPIGGDEGGGPTISHYEPDANGNMVPVYH